MYINYQNDRKSLGFNCFKDINFREQFKTDLKNLIVWVIEKNEQVIFLVFSKEGFIACFIFFRSLFPLPDVEISSFRSPGVEEFQVISSDNFKFSNSSPYESDFILVLKGGSSEPTQSIQSNDDRQIKLIESVLAKTPQTKYSQTSINKVLKKILKLIEPVIFNKQVWKLLSEFQRPLKSDLGTTQVSSIDILGTYAPSPASRSSSSIFVEGFSNDDVSPMRARVQYRMAQKKVRQMTQIQSNKNNLDSSGLSLNHEELSEDQQSTEKLTKLRRAEPLYPSQVLGDSFKYGRGQLGRKGPDHLPDFEISIEGKTSDEIAAEYQELAETLLRTILAHPDGVIRPDGKLNKREPTINFGNPDTFEIIAFGNDPLYEDHHFISAYPLTKDAFKDFEKTGNIGLSSEERQAELEKQQQLREAEEKEARASSAHKLFYNSLPVDGRISYQQLRQAEAIQEQLTQNPQSTLSDKDQKLLERAERYKKYKDQFFQNNPHLARDEF